MENQEQPRKDIVPEEPISSLAEKFTKGDLEEYTKWRWKRQIPAITDLKQVSIIFPGGLSKSIWTTISA